jgi:hypothetical protein
MPVDVGMATYAHNAKLYNRIQADNPRGRMADIRASVLLISGCQDWQLSMDGDRNGVFTAAVKLVWDDGRFEGSYLDFHAALDTIMPASQKPNYFKIGVPDPSFDMGRPFTI